MLGRSKSSLVLSRSLLLKLEGLARRAYPAEACGLLLGRQEGSQFVVIEHENSINLATRPTEFELDPASVVRAEARSKQADMRILGVWHSHPNESAVPSVRDLEGVWSGWLQWIVSLDDSKILEGRAWRMGVAGELSELPVFCGDAQDG